MIQRKTKIVCTLGPSTTDDAVLRELMLSGMNVARLNFSHGDHAEHKARLDMVKKLREKYNLVIHDDTIKDAYDAAMKRFQK